MYIVARRLGGFELTVVVAMRLAGTVQVTVDKIIDVVAVGHSFMAAARAMFVTGIMAGALVVGCALGRMRTGIFQFAFVDMVAMHMVQMTIVNVIYMVTMFDGGVAAVAAMLVVMVAMCLTSHKKLLKDFNKSVEKRPGAHPNKSYSSFVNAIENAVKRFLAHQIHAQTLKPFPEAAFSRSKIIKKSDGMTIVFKKLTLLMVAQMKTVSILTAARALSKIAIVFISLR